jgi:hypothetical protein
VLHAPQLITDARMLFVVWIPADPDAAMRLLPEGLTAADQAPVYMNQYVVDDENQTSGADDPDGFGAYSLTYLGVELTGLDTEAGQPGRFWTHYFDSSPNMIDYAAKRGVPAGEGSTTLELAGGKLVATTSVGGTPTIRSTASVEVGTPIGATGQLRYITKVGGELVSGRYPFVAKVAESFGVDSIEFLDPSHPVYALRPADPLEITFGFYSPAISFAYPGGEGPLGSEHGS